jgi:hypothetical protein
MLIFALESNNPARLHALCRLGGGPLVSRLPLKPIKLQPVKQGTGPAGVIYRAFVSSSVYLQAYRISAGLLPKLATLHDDLASSGIPMGGQLQAGTAFSCDGLRAMPLHEVRLGQSECWSGWCLQSGVISKTAGAGPLYYNDYWWHVVTNFLLHYWITVS